MDRISQCSSSILQINSQPLTQLQQTYIRLSKQSILPIYPQVPSTRRTWELIQLKCKQVLSRIVHKMMDLLFNRLRPKLLRYPAIHSLRSNLSTTKALVHTTQITRCRWFNLLRCKTYRIRLILEFNRNFPRHSKSTMVILNTFHSNSNLIKQWCPTPFRATPNFNSRTLIKI